QSRRNLATCSADGSSLIVQPLTIRPAGTWYLAIGSHSPRREPTTSPGMPDPPRPAELAHRYPVLEPDLRTRGPPGLPLNAAGALHRRGPRRCRTARAGNCRAAACPGSWGTSVVVMVRLL